MWNFPLKLKLMSKTGDVFIGEKKTGKMLTVDASHFLRSPGSQLDAIWWWSDHRCGFPVWNFGILWWQSEGVQVAKNQPLEDWNALDHVYLTIMAMIRCLILFDKITYDVNHRNSSQVQTLFRSSLCHCFLKAAITIIYIKHVCVYCIYNIFTHYKLFDLLIWIHIHTDTVFLSQLAQWCISEVSPDRSTLKIQGREREKLVKIKGCRPEFLWLF